jgi:hypothetical protein
MNETIFFAFPSGNLVYSLNKEDEIDDEGSTFYNFNGDVKVKDVQQKEGMGLVGCDRSILHTSKHIKRKELIQPDQGDN